MRPVLKPALRRLWRDGSTLQLGVDPDRSTVLGGLDPTLLGTLDLLDGTRRLQDVVRDAVEVGSGSAAAESLVAMLQGAGALDDASGAMLFGGADERARMAPEHASLSLLHPAPGLARELLARRRRAHVRVVGAGRIGGTLARLLTASGVGGISLVDPGVLRPADLMPGGPPGSALGLPRQLALAGLPEPLRPPVDLVVIAPIGSLEIPLTLAAALVEEGTPHLVARVRELNGVIGPLVLPGRTPCLTCLHLHRSDRDPAWPVISAQLLGPERDEDPAAVALCATVAGLACLQALAFLDAPPSAGTLPASAGGTLELALPDWRVRRRSWPVHPLCGCVDDEPADDAASARAGGEARILQKSAS